MSKQTGFMTLEGKLGNVSFYKRGGVSRARMKSGISKDRILKDRKFKRTRENVSEFQGLAQSVSSFRSAIKQTSNFKDGTLGQRLTKVFRIMMKRGPGLRGQRAVQLSTNRSLLEKFEINGAANFATIFAPDVTPGIVRNNGFSVKTEIKNVHRDMIEAATGATHYRLVQLVGLLANTVYDETSKLYVPSNPDLNGKSFATYSEYVPLNSASTVNFELITENNAVN